jgi:hypothetical protein
MQGYPFSLPRRKQNLAYKFGGTALASFTTCGNAHRGRGGAFDISEFGPEHFSHLPVGMMCVEGCYKLFWRVLPVDVECDKRAVVATDCC